MKRPRGFTLIEVLVAIVVLSIGLIGIAGLLVSVIGRNQSSVYHSVAVSLATDIAERMRANSKEFSLTSGSNTYTSLLSSGNPAASAAACESATGNCDTATMAGYDAYKWEQLVSKVLPRGKGVVCFDQYNAADDGDLTGAAATPPVLSNTGCDASGNVVVIKIFWDETHSGGNASTAGAGDAKNTQRYVLVFQP
ncbi:MAG TPA: type IV pilus modification protein PilV [Rhodocyclaceae bacterium]|nr:type IV pilus modification protein PilV [Rhodocyclaceae bacterium]